MFAYEGAGTVLPVQEITKDKEAYGRIVTLVLFTTLSLYLVFGGICSASWGDEIKTSMITDMLPKCQASSVVVLLSICLNLTFSYPL